MILLMIIPMILLHRSLTKVNRQGSDMGEDEPGDVTVEVSDTTGHIELRVSGLCAFCSFAVGPCIYIYIIFLFSLSVPQI